MNKKHKIDDVYDKLFLKILKYIMFTKINQKLKIAPKIDKLSKEELKDIKVFWNKYLKKINVKWHLWYKSVNRTM